MVFRHHHARAWLAACLVFASACASNGPMTTPCAVSAECAIGSACVDGYCTPSGSMERVLPDGGDAGLSLPPTDGGVIVPVDVGPISDAPTGSACTEGAVEACITTCGTTGTRTCVASAWMLCAPPAEICNGLDEDCDGVADEGVTRACTNSCGSGVETCTAGTFAGCSAPAPTAESCNNRDDDCDGTIDEGVTRACSNMCGAGTETCSAGAFSGCTARFPTAEACNAIDDDCDGVPDDGLTRSCTTACGNGTETCSGGAYGGCTARAPTGEACNRVDDDCNGVIDDGMRVAVVGTNHTVLRTHHPECTAANAASAQCNAASNRFCGATCGGRSGMLVEDDGTNAVALCMGVDHQTVPWGSLTAQQPSCTLANISTVFCANAAHRYCRAVGYASGIGVQEASATDAVIGCIRGADGSGLTPTARTTIIETFISRLATVLPGCNSAGAAGSLVCRAAAHRLCASNGYSGGFGPVEVSGNNATIVCLSP